MANTSPDTEQASPKKSSYVPLKYTLMGSFLLLIIPILIAISISDYLNAKNDLEHAYSHLQKQTENNILNAIRLVDAGHRVLAKLLGEQMKKSFTQFISAYEASGRDASKMDLVELKRRLGGKMDLYLINADGIVEYTTYTKDLGLDFKQWEDVYAFFTTIRQKNNFVDGQLATEARTGLLRKFAYMPTPDNKYLLELGLVSDEFAGLMGELDLIKITDRLKKLNPSLSDVRIFSRHGHLLGDPDYKVDKKTADIITSVYTGKRSYTTPKTEYQQFAHYIFINLKDESMPISADPSKVIELTYNTKIIDESLQRSATFHFILSIIAIILSVIVTFFISAWLTRPINRLVKSVNIIAQGNLEYPIEVQANNELKLLKQSITIMVDSMLDYINKIRQQNVELKELDKLKDDFLSNTSHELRTPMNGIIGIAESMVDGATGRLSADAVKNLTMIIFSGKRLSNLVNDILDFSKLKHKNIALQLQPVEARVVTDVVVTLSMPLLGQKNVTIHNHIPENLTVYTDENRIQQILHNIIGNAVKFTEQGHIKIHAEEQGDHIKIYISDTGLGIEEEKLKNVFIPFEQVDGSVEREYGGTGLGLSITKQLVELHGGEISIRSRVGVGTEVEFTLPRASKTVGELAHDVQDMLQRLESNTDAIPQLHHDTLLLEDDTPIVYEQALAEEADNTEALNVLIVDDDIINLQVLENQLKLENYTITRAQNGRDALDIIHYSGKEFVIVLLDIMMPKMSGFEVCRIIRETYPAAQLPVIMLTAKNQVSDLVEGLHSGANDYLTKPFSKGELITRIKTHVELARVNIAYSNFVPLEFLELLEKKSIIDVHLGDHVQKKMAVLFVDIRSFTSLSESMTPKENFDFINQYLGRVSPVIRQYNGFIDKYIGDAIMALFATNANDALNAAIEIHQQLDKLNTERTAKNRQAIKVGIGVHIGTLMLGTIGEEKRMEGTVISDAVNLASRLEGLTKLYNTSILISADLLAALDNPTDYETRFLGKVCVKGKKAPIEVFEVMDAEPEKIMQQKIVLRPAFASAMSAYYKQDFIGAQQRFRQVLAQLPLDRAAAFYLERCQHYLIEGTPQNWDGVEALTEK